MATKREAVQLPTRAYDTLREEILTLRVLPGAPLVERDIAAELAMSPTPVRETLQRLEHEGLVVRSAYRSCRVSTISMQDVEEIYELRQLLEGRCARIAAVALPDESCQWIIKRLEEAEHWHGAKDRAAAGDLLWGLHDLLMEPVRNGRLKDYLCLIRAQARRIGTITTYVPGRLEKSLEEHRALARAITGRDPDRAERTMIAHLQGLVDDLRDDYEHGGLSVAFLVQSGPAYPVRLPAETEAEMANVPELVR